MILSILFYHNTDSIAWLFGYYNGSSWSPLPPLMCPTHGWQNSIFGFHMERASTVHWAKYLAWNMVESSHRTCHILLNANIIFLFTNGPK